MKGSDDDRELERLRDVVDHLRVELSLAIGRSAEADLIQNIEKQLSKSESAIVQRIRSRGYVR